MYKATETIEIKGFDHIQMEVRELEEAVEFWSHHFGFALYQVGIRLGKRWAIIGTPNQLFLCLHEDRAKAQQDRTGTRITHFGLITHDFIGARNRLKAAGIKLEPEDHLVEYNESRSFYFFEPNSYKIEISEFWGGNLA